MARKASPAGSGRNWLDLLVAILVVATVYVLVRPQSKGAALMGAVLQALQAIVASAADLGAPEGT